MNKIDLNCEYIHDIVNMSDYNHYYVSEINRLNRTELWRYSIETPNNKNTNVCETYVLYATNDVDLSGRKYFALPSNINASDPKIKRKYNLL
jgi:hypothetical protein